MNASLQGLRILVVEDEFLVAILIEEILEGAGCMVSGPMPRLAEALDAASHEACDAAVLDVNLAGERIDPVAEMLSRRNIPFVFVTGYSAGGVPDRYAERPRVCKPFRVAELLDTLAGILEPAAQAAAPPDRRP